jgi:hypothetical protein
MRSVSISVVALFLLSVTAARAEAQALSADDRAFIDQHISDLLAFKAEPILISDPAVNTVFAGPLYQVKLGLTVLGFSSTLIVGRDGPHLVRVDVPSGSKGLPDFPKRINPAFRLVRDDDAKLLQRALDVIYPILSGTDKDAETFHHANDRWLFVRGTFFEKSKGYVFKTDANGIITSVEYSLDLK